LKRALALGAATGLVIPAGMAGVLIAAVSAFAGGGGAPSDAARAEIPAAYLSAYMQAASTCPGLPWPVLAAIGSIESGHGTTGGAHTAADGTVEPPIVGVALDGSGGTAAVRVPAGGSPWHDDPTWDHAAGPMQFITGTWASWGVDANGDGFADPHNAFDAILTAARYLCGPDGEVTSIDDALWSYNPSVAYRDTVIAKAATYGSLARGAVSADADRLLARPNVHLDPRARADLEAGIVDPRVVAALNAAADAGFDLGVGVIETGHSQFVAGTNSVSNHWYGRAVDIHTVNDTAVSDTNTDAWSLAWFFFSLPGPARPDELGHPWGSDPALMGQLGSFSNADHEDHLHIGWDSPPG